MQLYISDTFCRLVQFSSKRLPFIKYTAIVLGVCLCHTLAQSKQKKNKFSLLFFDCYSILSSVIHFKQHAMGCLNKTFFHRA